VSPEDDGARPGGRAGRRAPFVWTAVCAAGAALVLLASGRDWARVAYRGRTGGAGLGEVALTGGQLVGHLSASALAALAAVAAVLAARGGWRRLIGAVVSLCGAAVVLGTWSGLRTGDVVAAAAAQGAVSVTGAATTSVGLFWPVVAVLGGCVLAVGGAVAVARAGRWPGMSDRYDRPGSRSADAGRTSAEAGRARGERALWDAIDRGADPTADLTADSGETTRTGNDREH
jgi:uncharacterized membrane protein (TIGR02234 family)